ncbi:ChaB family protein [Rickettsia endosymbiont of Halotydeus destructor]|uniref:ChaB family protein n=1 Tax=Rickettsia endosymbiont of Halotydeus destructor TaxID=2996754 RepID=UPI003BAE2A3C
MQYKNNDSLPDSVKNHLPKHAQNIYRETFNHAFEEYKSPEKRRGNDSQETVAHKVAWAAIEKKYYKNEEGKWLNK